MLKKLCVIWEEYHGQETTHILKMWSCYNVKKKGDEDIMRSLEKEPDEKYEIKKELWSINAKSGKQSPFFAILSQNIIFHRKMSKLQKDINNEYCCRWWLPHVPFFFQVDFRRWCGRTSSFALMFFWDWKWMKLSISWSNERLGKWPTPLPLNFIFCSFLPESPIQRTALRK